MSFVVRNVGLYNRRQFIKLLGGTAGVLLLEPFHKAMASSPISPESKLGLRGTQDGKILAWDAGAASWKTACNLGEHLAVESLTAIPGGFVAQVRFDTLSFNLYSSDGATWRNYPFA